MLVGETLSDDSEPHNTSEIRIQHELGLNESPIGLKDLIGWAPQQSFGLYAPYSNLLVPISIPIHREYFEIGKIRIEHKLRH